MGVRRKHIRELAENLLQKHNPKGVPVHVKTIVEALGIEIKLEEVDDGLSGFLYRERKSGRTIIGANAKHPKNRLNFTIAHELGHFLLHEGETVHLDGPKPGYTIQLRDRTSSTGEELSEREANLFAAELLMPAKFLKNDLRGKSFDLLVDDEFLKKLATKYGVSLQALTIRLDYLGYIDH